MQERLVGEHGTEMVVPVKVHKILHWVSNGIVTIPPEISDVEHVDLQGFFGLLEWTDVKTLRKLFRQQNDHRLQAPPEKRIEFDTVKHHEMMTKMREAIGQMPNNKFPARKQIFRTS